MAFLTLMERGEQPKTRQLSSRMVIGRGDDCDWIIPSRQLSRKHLLIQAEQGGWEVHDLGSTNGTLIGAQRIIEHTLLDRDELNIGGLTLVFTLGANGASNDPIADGLSPAASVVAADSPTDQPPAQTWSLRREPDQQANWESLLAPNHSAATKSSAALRDRLESITSGWQQLDPKRRRQALIASSAALLLLSMMFLTTSSPRLPSAKVNPATLDQASGSPKPAQAIDDQPV